jgi:excisionase family DNA binding protein
MTTRKQCRTDNPKSTSTEDFTPILMNRKRAAAMLSISLRGLDYLIAEGRIHTRKIGGRVLVPTEELHRFARADRTAPMVPQNLVKAA